jgi:hypothetical protein
VSNTEAVVVSLSLELIMGTHQIYEVYNWGTNKNNVFVEMMKLQIPAFRGF